MDDGFFQSELTWDGIIALVAIALGIIGTAGAWGRGIWRRNHPIRASYALDPYDDQASDIYAGRQANRWDVYPTDFNQVLIKITPHNGTTFRKLRLRLVERRWFSGWRLWRWISADRKKIRMNAMVDMRYACSSSPLYYFESNDEPATASFLGEYFNDHDHSRGVDIPAGSSLWIGVVVSAYDDWSGRLEIDTDVGGRRIFERKPFRATKSAEASMDFSFGKTMQPTQMSTQD